MAFNPMTLSLTVQTIGGACIRIWMYETSDVRATVEAPGYFDARAHSAGIRAGDMVFALVDTGGDPRTIIGSVLSASSEGVSISFENLLFGSWMWFSDRLVVEETAIPDIIDRIVIAGYGAPNDGGGASFKRALSEPSHPGKIQSENDVWFEIDDQVLNCRSFGALPGNADNADALNDWLTTIKITGRAGFAQPGTYDFKSAISLDGVNAVTIDGYGAVLNYTGDDTDIDLVTFGDGVEQLHSWSVRGLRVTSETVMTDGTGIRLRRVNRSIFRDLIPDGQDGTGNLWNGIWFNEVGQVIWDGFTARAQNDAVRVNGQVGSGPKAGLFLNHGKILNSTVGLRCGGAYGGLSIGQVDIIANGENLVIDTTLSAEANREIFVSSQCSIDSTTSGASIRVSDTLAGSSSYFALDGTWIASATEDCLYIDEDVSMQVIITGGSIFNAGRDGIRNDSTLARLIVDGTRIRANAAYGINSTVDNPFIEVRSPSIVGNGTASYNGNIHPIVYDTTTSSVRWATSTDLNANATPFERVTAAGDAIEGWQREFRRARGSVASPTAVQSEDNIGDIAFVGYDGSSYVNAALIRSAATGTVSTGVVPGYVDFLTRDLSGSIDTRMRLNSEGRLGIGTIAPNYLLHVFGTLGFSPGSSVTPASNGDVVIELTNNTTVTIKAKGSDGTVRSGVVSLS